ncbi:MAG: AAA family ATPase [Candidatus Portiera sp.]|nr:AAA family ATPase [Portiera sp.]
MEYTVEVTNFGKIKQAKIKINDLTVFAGTNNTGKSYVSRLLYSIFSAITSNPEIDYQKRLVKELYLNLKRENSRFSRSFGMDREWRKYDMESSGKLFRLQRKIDSDFAKTLDDSDLLITADNSTEIIAKQILEEFEVLIDEFQSDVKTIIAKLIDQEVKSSAKKTLDKRLKVYSEALDKHLIKFRKELNGGETHFIEQEYKNKFNDNLIENFQAEELKDLIGNNKNKSSTIQITSSDGDAISLNISKSGEIDKVSVDVIDHEVYSDIVYLESPIYWKLRSALTTDVFHYNRRMRRERLADVPKYFYDLIEKMRERRITAKNDAKIRDTLSQEIKNIIGGHIIEDKNSGELLFVENSGSKTKTTSKKGISLHITATGVSQLGMIAHLIDKKIIRQGTILFLDEPEAHLHPAWQDKMMEILYGFTKYGVQVIMATHSPMMIQRLELSTKQDKSPSKVSLNYFNRDGEFDSIAQAPDKISDAINNSLESPAYKTYLKSLVM